MTATISVPQSVKTSRQSRNTDQLRVVIVDEELPYPLTSGKRIRTFNLIRRLANQHQLTYLCYRNPNEQEQRQALGAFQELGIETVIVDRVIPKKSGVTFYARLAWNLLSSMPYSVTSHDSSALRQAITDYAATHEVDLWHCEWTPYAQPLSVLTNARQLVMAHNVESMIWQRYRDTESNPLKRWYIHQQWKKFANFERRAMQQADCGVAVSRADANFFAKEMQAENVEVVDNGVDIDFFQPPTEPRPANRILFLGSLDWRPNLDAVAQLFDEIFPALIQQVPEAKLSLVGRNPPEWVRQRASEMNGVELHANVADVRPYIADSSVMAVPLRIGGGSRLKILEALATELPVVSTSVGAEGLHLNDGEHLAIANGVEHFVSALKDALQNQERANQMAQAGRQRILEQYTWEVLADRLEQIWLDCANRDNRIN